MKQIIFLFAFCFSVAIQAQEETIELLDIFSRTEQTICNGDTTEALYFKVEKVSIDNGTDYPNISVDTTLFMNGVCPADSLEVLRQLEVEAEGIQQKASGVMSNAFQRTKRGQSEYQELRTVYNSFTGSELYMFFEDKFNGIYAGTDNKWRIVDIQDDTNVTATMIRVGADDRYRLEVDAGEPGEGTRYTILPLSSTSFQINQWAASGGTAKNIKLYKDRSANNPNPVFREEGYLIGGTEDELRIIKVR